MPLKPGVYLFKDNKGNTIYVGKAKNLKKRVSTYFQKKIADPKTSILVSQINSVSYILVKNELESFLLEAELIKKHKPYFNIKMADDKFYPYIAIIEDNIPYVAIVRKKTLKNAVFFGPFPDGSGVKIVLKLLRKIFPYESVKNHSKRKCLYFHLGLCPCVQAVPENLPVYKKNIEKLKQFLSGNTKQIFKILKEEQKNYIKNEDFENAGIVQKQLEAIERITQEKFDPFLYMKNPDILRHSEENENKSLKELLMQNGLSFSKFSRIECYDISNLQGTNATGSMVVVVNGSISKQDYRKFKIKRKKTPDDFAMHQEVISRRLNHTEWNYPDLIIIDGGKGQVSSVLQVLAHKNVKIPVIGVAKKFETLVIPKLENKVLTFKEARVPLTSPSINLVRRIRDEAHRFAVTYHRKLRSKNSFLS